MFGASSAYSQSGSGQLSVRYNHHTPSSRRRAAGSNPSSNPSSLSQLALAEFARFPKRGDTSACSSIPDGLLGIPTGTTHGEALADAVYELQRSINRQSFRASHSAQSNLFLIEVNALYSQLTDTISLTEEQVVHKPISRSGPFTSIICPTLQLAASNLLSTFTTATASIGDKFTLNSKRTSRLAGKVDRLSHHCMQVEKDFDHLLSRTLPGDVDAHRCALREAEESLRVRDVLHEFKEELAQHHASSAKRKIEEDDAVVELPMELRQRIGDRLFSLHIDHTFRSFQSVLAEWVRSTRESAQLLVQTDEVVEALRQRAFVLQLFRQRTLDAFQPTPASTTTTSTFPSSSSPTTTLGSDPFYTMRLEVLMKAATDSKHKKALLHRHLQQEHTRHTSRELRNMIDDDA